MPTNDPVNDSYNPPGNLSEDFEKFKFGELEVDDLFWQTNGEKENNPWRKISETQAQNLKSQSTHAFQPSTVVFLKI